ncbi:MAG: hypothetical protein RML95_14715 [Anaerolineae bacterium]|nr:hypothetical protein [Anaerolineae bacterium]
MNAEQLFWQLYDAPDEDTVHGIIARYPNIFKQENWRPLGGTESNYSIVENQQSNPVAALVEKIINSIDAILMRRCIEAGIDPRSPRAPRSVQEALERFFPERRDWNLGRGRSSEKLNKQAESIQVLRDGKSLLVYDDGEGQHPEDFEATFLSLLRKNKNDIHFVQGKYNMGGSGALVFCGKHRYQLIASKRFDGSGNFGFTLVRRHPFTAEEQRTMKSTWYEYLTLNGAIPAFRIGEIDLRLFRRMFRTGTVIKLYSYELTGNSDVSRDLGRSVQEYLYNPALPFYMVQSRDGHGSQHTPWRVIYGLKNRLENDDNEFVEEFFHEKFEDQEFGTVVVSVYVFKVRAGQRDAKETRKAIQENYFKNNMAVLFSVNGQVHGHYTAEFITRTLQYNLLRDYLLIHVDCTDMNPGFRNELFMASRDRLRQSKESSELRKKLAVHLREGRLAEIYKQRKAQTSADHAEDEELIRKIAQKVEINENMRRLLRQAIKTQQTDPTPKPTPSKPKEHHDPKPFHPKRYPTFFKLDAKQQGDRTVIAVPLGGTKTVRFETDVSDDYFSRTEDPGDMQIAVMDYVPNDVRGGTRKGTVNQIADIFTVSKKSPSNGTIKIVLEPNKNAQVGDEARLRVDLKNPAGEDFTQIFWVRITEPPAEPKEVPPTEPETLGLPQLVRVYERAPEDQPDVKTWADLPVDMNFETVMHPVVEGDVLQTIYINMDSHVLKQHRSKLRNASREQLQLIDRRYAISIYYHTLFLYAINKNRGFSVAQGDKDVDLTDYLRELFDHHYAEFLLSFEMDDLIDALA